VSKAGEYRAKAAKWEKRAEKMRDLNHREWQTILARAYLMLADVEAEAASQRRRR
jgi:hypothetical protein